MKYYADTDLEKKTEPSRSPHTKSMRTLAFHNEWDETSANSTAAR